jgi:hypothetical protein
VDKDDLVRAGMIDWSPAGAIVGPDRASMKIAVSAAKRPAIVATSGLLALTLDLADKVGRLEEDVSEGVYLERSADGAVKEVYRYSTEIDVLNSVGVIHFRLVDHPELRSIRAELRDGGNSGLATLVHIDGSITTQRW